MSSWAAGARCRRRGRSSGSAGSPLRTSGRPATTTWRTSWPLAYSGWWSGARGALERAAGEQLLFPNGCLDIGPVTGHVFAGVERSAREHGVPVERLDARELMRRYPGFHVLDGFEALLDPAGGYLAPERCPVWIVDDPAGQFSSFPIHGIPGFKLGRMHHLDEQVDPDAFRRELGPADEAVLRAFAERWFPEAAGPTMSLATCLFTNTQDEHFLIDLLPQDPRVVVVSLCSGHGFKFCSGGGDLAAALALALPREGA